MKNRSTEDRSKTIDFVEGTSCDLRELAQFFFMDLAWGFPLFGGNTDEKNRDQTSLQFHHILTRILLHSIVYRFIWYKGLVFLTLYLKAKTINIKYGAVASPNFDAFSQWEKYI